MRKFNLFLILVLFSLVIACFIKLSVLYIPKDEINMTTVKDVKADEKMEENIAIGGAETLFDGTIENKATNIRIAAEAVNEFVIPVSKVFSFNQVVGETTLEKGYKYGDTFVKTNQGTKIVQGIGGGICQVSSTLYMACKKAGLEIIERAPHSMEVSYCTREDEAAISYGWLDYKFKNNTESSIVIRTHILNNDSNVPYKLICEIYKVAK